MKTDIQIQEDVMNELKWQPFLTSSEIGVAVKNGIVTLTGIVDTYSKKLYAEKAVKRVAGVKAVAEDIQVGFSPSYRKTDTEIADAVFNALKWHAAVQEDKIRIKVDDGMVTLEGEVEWDYQRVAAKIAIQNLTGVRSVLNLITLRPRISPVEIEKKIKSAFQRHASIDSSKIWADVLGNKVTLRGKVRSFTEKEDAENAAWAAPGVAHIESKLEVEEPEYVY
ncbi:BON domain-containing protein [Mucilaginibacter sp.]|jgi:osmotically-inducible protein OsmY|uniref:BON domain-containing protein n=1 Tax=Mucilaginibacter sp. TaxID=1882438 RepID=UPI002CA1C364|nr:BON domain-containing protein [Mucilaginibacter sp.]HTI60225.1 BON domain-containing protein [Mucilaginibacter sp.]